MEPVQPIDDPADDGAEDETDEPEEELELPDLDAAPMVEPIVVADHTPVDPDDDVV